MTISVIHNSIKYPELPYEVKALMSAGEELSIPVHMMNLHSDKSIEENLAKLGNAVIYRTSNLTGRAERTKYLKAIVQDRILINDLLLAEPLLRHKSYQQKKILERTSLNTIKTFQVSSRDELEEAMREHSLSWPLIQKPDGGVKGRDVSLVHSIDKVATNQEIGRFIFQPFIHNDGDFRLLIVGGEMIGIMKRIAAPGSILNNISQGGRGEYVTDPSIIRELAIVAEAVISAFPLHIVGVDVIKNQADDKFYFLEINLMPGWVGFEEVAGVGVAKRIVTMCQALVEGSFSFPAGKDQS